MKYKPRYDEKGELILDIIIKGTDDPEHKKAVRHSPNNPKLDRTRKVGQKVTYLQDEDTWDVHNN